MRTLLDKFFEMLTRLGIDKYQHFTFGAIVACIAALATCWLPMWATVITSILATSVVAIGKELFDDTADWWDFGAAMFGGLVVWVGLIIS